MRRRHGITAVGIAAVIGLVVGLVPDASAADPRTLIVSRHSAGTYGNSSSRDVSISDDGRFIAFESVSDNLVSGDTNGKIDVFVHDLMTGRTTLVSRHSVGTYGNENSEDPSISADGRFVAFESNADNLVSGDDDLLRDIFVHDRLASTTGRTTRVSRHSLGNEADNGSFAPSISADGRFVTFESNASNLVSDDNPVDDIFIHDRLASTTGRTLLVSRHSLGNPGDSGSNGSAVSGDGRFVAFGSTADNLVSGDTNTSADIFVRRRY